MDQRDSSETASPKCRRCINLSNAYRSFFTVYYLLSTIYCFSPLTLSHANKIFTRPHTARSHYFADTNMEKEFRPSVGTQVLFLGPWVVFLIITVVQHFSGEMPYGVPLGLLLILLCGYFALRTLVVTVAIEGISVRKLFVERSLLWQDVAGVTTKAEMVGSKPRYRTLIRSNNPSSADLSINIKFLSKADAAELARTLIDRCPQAQIDDSTKRMAEGQMPSIH